VTLRAEEALESMVTNELPIGFVLEIIEVGEIPRRAKVQAGSIQGWISVKTRSNELLIQKRVDLSLVIADFKIGGQHQVISLVTLRAAESLDSEVITELGPGTLVKIVELGKDNKRRGKVETEIATGWISMTTRQGDLLIGKLQGIGSGQPSAKIKVMLESARCGDLDAMKKIVEGGSGLMGKLSSRPNLNCSDLRGKTSLIYASAFGNKNIVDYLLTKKHEVEVNGMDDTQKSALHHAAKQARKLQSEARDNVQADLVRALIAAGAIVEARDHNGCTPLMFAVANGDAQVARVLLEGDPNQPGSGAQVNVKDYEGHTPLDYAKNFGYEELVTLLKDFNAVDEDPEEDGEEDVEAEKEGIYSSIATLDAAIAALKAEIPRQKARDEPDIVCEF
jgi:ankyrin repeat protein